jgi:hypothetical protein
MVGEKRLSPESRVSQAILMAVNSFTQAPPVLRPGQTGINYNLLPAPPASQRNAWTDSIMSHDSVESSPCRVFLPTESLHFTQPTSALPPMNTSHDRLSRVSRHLRTTTSHRLLKTPGTD